MRFWTAVIVLILSLFTCLQLAAQGERGQRTKEFGVGLGSFYYLGELNQEHFNEIQPGIHLSYRRNLSRRIGFNFSFSQGQVSGADSLSEVAFQQNRNLHFQSKIQEFAVVFEINFFDYQLANKKYPFSPYLFFGLSAFHFNPKAASMVDGKMRELQPIGTEGQNLEGGSPYNLFNFAIPFGLGIRVSLVNKLGITVFAGMRRTFTDYLDDVSGSYSNPADFAENDREFVDRSKSPALGDGTNAGLQRGNAENKDWYTHTGIMLSYKIQKKRNMCPAWYAN